MTSGKVLNYLTLYTMEINDISHAYFTRLRESTFSNRVESYSPVYFLKSKSRAKIAYDHNYS